MQNQHQFIIQKNSQQTRNRIEAFQVMRGYLKKKTIVLNGELLYLWRINVFFLNWIKGKNIHFCHL